MNSITLRTILLVAVAAVIPACGGSGSDGGDAPPAPPAPPIVLLTDTFDGGFPGTNWTFSSNVMAGTTASATVDSSAIGGNPAPGLRLDVVNPPPPPTPQNPTNTGTAGVSGLVYFNSQGPLTVSFDLKCESNSGTAYFSIVSFGTPDVLGMRINSASNVIYQIGIPFVSGPSSNGFHHFVVSIDSAGNTQWSRDGVTQLVGSYPHLNNLRIDFSYTATSWGTTSAYFDNILVTSP